MGRTNSTLPPEVCELILDQLDNISSYSVIDYINVLKEKGDNLLHDLVTERLVFIDITCAKDQKGMDTIIGLSRKLNDETLIIRKGIRRILFVMGPSTDIASINWDKLVIEGNSQNGVKFDILYFGPPEISQGGETKSKVSVLEDTLEKLEKFPEWLLRFFSKHLIIEFDNHDSILSTGKSLFGILDTKICKYYNTANPIHVKQISFPSLKRINVNYMSLDAFIYQVFLSGKLQMNDINYNEPTPNSILTDYLTNLKIFCPNLQNISFAKYSNDQSTGHIVVKETCNFIDLSTIVLEKFRTFKVRLRFLFQIHSLKNWIIPNIKEISGHRFKFDNNSASSNLNESCNTLQKNLNLLHDLVVDETRDATSYFRINLIPEGVEKTRILNWVPLVNLISKKETPVLFLNCLSLKHLELKPLFMGNYKKMIIQGLYLPNLLTLTFYDEKSVESLLKPMLTMKHNNYEMKEIIPVEFSSWNDIPNCKQLKFTDTDESKAFNYIYEIKNLQYYLPKLSLVDSFPNFVDEKQNFIVI